MTVEFLLEGQHFVALNGGPHFTFNEAISFIVHCETQEELDYYWEKLSEGGDEKAQVCGWLKDKFGVSWQIVPANKRNDNRLRSGKIRTRHEGFTPDEIKIDMQTLQQAYEG